MKKRSPPCIGDARGNYVFLRKTKPDEILELAASILERRIRKGDVLQGPTDTKRYLSFQIGSLEHETFCMLLS